jgi:ribonuclease BN (tRNA processing enzyme)
VRITVLGKSPAWQDAGGACSGYLIQEGDYSLLLDCGNGVFSKLRGSVDYVDLSALLISHVHADHCLDLIPYAYALTYAPRQQPVAVGGWPGTDTPARPPLHAPAGSSEVFRQISACWGNPELVEKAFSLTEYNGPELLTLGPFSVTLCEVPHYTTTYAARITAPDGSTLTYSADCSPNDALVHFAHDTDVLLIEATLPRPERTGIRGHLTPREAGDHARRADAHRVILTHYSDELDPAWALDEGCQGFGGPVELAQEGDVYTVVRAAAAS